MTANAPVWLTSRQGGLRDGVNRCTVVVTLNDHPFYRLFATPADGRFTCAITQMNNGQRVDGGKEYPSVEAALEGGLNELREKLGW